MVHGPQEEEVAHGGIEEHLEEGAKASHFPDQKELASVAVFREEEVFVDPMHTEQGDDEACVTNKVVNHNIQNNYTRWRKAYKVLMSPPASKIRAIAAMQKTMR